MTLIVIFIDLKLKKKCNYKEIIYYYCEVKISINYDFLISAGYL